METTKVTISLNIQANSKFIARNEKIVREMMELFYFSELGLRKEDIGGWLYQLTFKHTDEDALKRQFSELLEISGPLPMAITALLKATSIKAQTIYCSASN